MTLLFTENRLNMSFASSFRITLFEAQGTGWDQKVISAEYRMNSKSKRVGVPVVRNAVQQLDYRFLKVLLLSRMTPTSWLVLTIYVCCPKFKLRSTSCNKAPDCVCHVP